MSERSFKLGELSDSDEESDEALSASTSPAASPAPARAGSRRFNPPPTGAQLHRGRSSRRANLPAATLSVRLHHTCDRALSPDQSVISPR